MDEDVIRVALKDVLDPELGVNIVDLGLVYSIEKMPDGVEIALIMTTPACPLGEMLVEQAEQALAIHCPNLASVRMKLLRDVVWSPERMTDDGRRQLGLTAEAKTEAISRT